MHIGNRTLQNIGDKFHLSFMSLMSSPITKNLLDQQCLLEILQRIDKLNPDSVPGWGKMKPSQMLAHCNISLETAMGRKTTTAHFLRRIWGWFFRRRALGDKPFGKNWPTYRGYEHVDDMQFATELPKLKATIREFAGHAAAGDKLLSHPLFGKLSTQQWALYQYKHLDHHLRQFGL